MGVDGNFIFSVAFLNANEYFWQIFSKSENESIENADDERRE